MRLFPRLGRHRMERRFLTHQTWNLIHGCKFSVYSLLLVATMHHFELFIERLWCCLAVSEESVRNQWFQLFFTAVYYDIDWHGQGQSHCIVKKSLVLTWSIDIESRWNDKIWNNRTHLKLIFFSRARLGGRIHGNWQRGTRTDTIKSITAIPRSATRISFMKPNASWSSSSRRHRWHPNN